MKRIIPNIPISDTIKKISAILSMRYSFSSLTVRMEINEKTDEIVKSIAIMDVNSSTKLLSALFVRCSDVIINRQKPSKLADVANMCGEVLFAIIAIRTF